MNEQASIAKIKSHLSEYIANVVYLNKRIIITKRNKPVAALVNIHELEKIESIDIINGLASVIGKWKNFEEIEGDIHHIYKSRKGNKHRKVSI